VFLSLTLVPSKMPRAPSTRVKKVVKETVFGNPTVKPKPKLTRVNSKIAKPKKSLTYRIKIKNAIIAIHDRKGATPQAIEKYLFANYGVVHLPSLKLALAKGLSSGWYTQAKGKRRFLLSASEKKDKRKAKKKKSKKTKKEKKLPRKNLPRKVQLRNQKVQRRPIRRRPIRRRPIRRRNLRKKRKLRKWLPQRRLKLQKRRLLNELQMSKRRLLHHREVSRNLKLQLPHPPLVQRKILFGYGSTTIMAFIITILLRVMLSKVFIRNILLALTLVMSVQFSLVNGNTKSISV